MMAVHIFLIICGFSETQIKRFRRYQHLFVWSYALGGTIPPLVLKKYSPMAYADYCYFPSPDDPLKLILYTPLTLCILFSIFFYFFMLSIHFHGKENMFKMKKKAIIKRLGFMVSIWVLTWSPAVYSRVLAAMGYPQPPALQLTGMTLGGFLNFVVWGLLNRRILDYLRNIVNNVKEFFGYDDEFEGGSIQTPYHLRGDDDDHGFKSLHEQRIDHSRTTESNMSTHSTFINSRQGISMPVFVKDATTSTDPISSEGTAEEGSIERVNSFNIEEA